MGAQSVLTSTTIAKLFGIHPTDLEVLDLIFTRGMVSAGDLAAATGLTSGSITAVIDRLTTKRFVRRQADPDDKRYVLVSVRNAAIAPIKKVYDELQARNFQLWATYSDADLEMISTFLTKSTTLAADYLSELTQSQPKTPRREPRPRAKADGAG